MSSRKILTASILSAMLAAGAFAAVGSVTASPAFAQTDYDNGQDDDSSRSSSNTTTAASDDATKISGVIASLQNNDAGAPAWITSGHWKLESDRSVFSGDNATEPRIDDFDATIYMTSITNGTDMHQHEISDFRQTSILHSSENVTTINGTFTISMSDGPHQNTSGYIRLQNNMISIWVDPSGLQEHFGPTPIYGMVLPDRLKADDDGHGDDDTATAAQGGNATTQETSGGDDDLYDDGSDD